MFEFRSCFLVALLAVGAAPGCDKSEGGDEGGGEAVSAEKAFSGLIEGKEPALFGPFKKLAFGMDRAAVEKQLPALFEDPNTYGKTLSARESLDEWAGAWVGVELEGGLVRVRMSMPAAEADKQLKAWGTPVKVERLGKPVLVWIGATSGLRATLEEMTGGEEKELTVEPYLSYAILADKSDSKMKFKPDGVLGKSPDELLKAFPDVVAKKVKNDKVDKQTDEMMKGLNDDIEKAGIKLRKDAPELDASLPATPYDDSSTLVVLHFSDDNKVRSYNVMVGYGGRPEAKDEIKAAFDKAWGESKNLKMTLGEEPFWYDPDNGLRVSIRFRDDQAEVNFDRYLPLAKLVGDKGPAWGFEKTPILGADVGKLAEVYGSALVRKEGASTATLRFEKTDYEGNSSVTQLLLFLKGDVVRQWRLNLGYKTYGPAHDEILALLKGKFGEPKAKGKEMIFSKKPKVVVRDDSKYTNSFDLMVGK